MPTLLRNTSNSTPECGTENKAEIDNRTEETITQTIIDSVRTEILDMHATITASTDIKIKNIKKATSFPVQDILDIIDASEGCTYLRVYNGFNAQGQFVTYIAPVNDVFESYLEEDLSDSSIISKSCCHCNPCGSDTILNP